MCRNVFSKSDIKCVKKRLFRKRNWCYQGTAELASQCLYDLHCNRVVRWTIIVPSRVDNNLYSTHTAESRETETGATSQSPTTPLITAGWPRVTSSTTKYCRYAAVLVEPVRGSGSVCALWAWNKQWLKECMPLSVFVFGITTLDMGLDRVRSTVVRAARSIRALR